ncbi:unnamed protein product [Closterium sp. Naga37s-1]|nr:unnamed protein product [Closterium sp. Naga37s-1]
MMSRDPARSPRCSVGVVAASALVAVFLGCSFVTWIRDVSQDSTVRRMIEAHVSEQQRVATLYEDHIAAVYPLVSTFSQPARRSAPPRRAWVERMGHRGPARVCQYAEAEVRAALARPHSCGAGEARYFYAGVWMTWEFLRYEVLREGAGGEAEERSAGARGRGGEGREERRGEERRRRGLREKEREWGGEWEGGWEEGREGPGAEGGDGGAGGGGGEGGGNRGGGEALVCVMACSYREMLQCSKGRPCIHAFHLRRSESGRVGGNGLERGTWERGALGAEEGRERWGRIWGCALYHLSRPKTLSSPILLSSARPLALPPPLSVPDLATLHRLYDGDPLPALQPDIGVRTVLDAGAGAGILSVLLACMYPTAVLVTTEASESGFRALSLNTAPYDNAIALRAALWSHVTSLVLQADGGRARFIEVEQNAVSARQGKGGGWCAVAQVVGGEEDAARMVMPVVGLREYYAPRQAGSLLNASSAAAVTGLSGSFLPFHLHHFSPLSPCSTPSHHSPSQAGSLLNASSAAAVTGLSGSFLLQFLGLRRFDLVRINMEGNARVLLNLHAPHDSMWLLAGPRLVAFDSRPEILTLTLPADAPPSSSASAARPLVAAFYGAQSPPAYQEVKEGIGAEYIVFRRRTHS